MKPQPRALYGELRCLVCRESWWTSWFTSVPHLICHLCGNGSVVPIGPQSPSLVSPSFVFGIEWALQQRAVRRCAS